MQEHSQPFDEIAVEDASDAMDRIQQAYERDLTIRRMESAFSRMQDISLALERIEGGTYGACLRCEDDISPERFHAIPWAGYCIRFPISPIARAGFRPARAPGCCCERLSGIATSLVRAITIFATQTADRSLISATC